MTTPKHRLLGAGLFLLLGGIGGIGCAWALQTIDSPAMDDHTAHQQAALDSSATQDHSAHLAAMAKPSYSVSSERYAIPDVQDRKSTRLNSSH
jgi:hypothetical protein